LCPDTTSKTSGESLHQSHDEYAHNAFNDAELLHCGDIGMADDAACRKAWAENRRHFLSTDRASVLMPERIEPLVPGEAPKP
jgi:conjugative transfer region protein TrbK